MYNLKLRVSDAGAVKDYGYATLQVKITDVNEPPRFTGPSCILNNKCLFKINENKAAGTVIGDKVTASDPDTKAGCTLSFHIISLDKNYFTIGKNTGIITTKNPLDREVKEDYSLEIEVSDCGSPKLTERRIVNVKALDENDNSPVFPYSSYRKNVREDLKTGSSVLTVSATGTNLFC